jgi:hypothetical protein
MVCFRLPHPLDDVGFPILIGKSGGAVNWTPRPKSCKAGRKKKQSRFNVEISKSR